MQTLDYALKLYIKNTLAYLTRMNGVGQWFVYFSRKPMTKNGGFSTEKTH